MLLYSPTQTTPNHFLLLTWSHSVMESLSVTCQSCGISSSPFPRYSCTTSPSFPSFHTRSLSCFDNGPSRITFPPVTLSLFLIVFHVDTRVRRTVLLLGFLPPSAPEKNFWGSHHPTSTVRALEATPRTGANPTKLSIMYIQHGTPAGNHAGRRLE